MPENNLPTDSELKIDDLFKNIDELILKRDFDEAFNLVEENRAYITKFANVKQQLLLNKYHTKILFELTLSAYEAEKDADKFLSLFEKNRDFFEVHLDKPKYNRLLRYTSNIKKNRRKKKLNIIIPVVFFLVALLIYGVATMDILPKISFNEIYSSVAEKFKSDKPDDADTPVLSLAESSLGTGVSARLSSGLSDLNFSATEEEISLNDILGRISMVATP